MLPLAARASRLLPYCRTAAFQAASFSSFSLYFITSLLL
jgi:hypothetical protein